MRDMFASTSSTVSSLVAMAYTVHLRSARHPAPPFRVPLRLIVSVRLSLSVTLTNYKPQPKPSLSPSRILTLTLTLSPSLRYLHTATGKY